MREQMRINGTVAVLNTGDNEDGSTTLHFASPGGSAVFTQYNVFPGISLTYNDITAPQIAFEAENVGDRIIEIDHCRDGRMECRAENGAFHLSPGDMSIHLPGGGKRCDKFPTDHYHGITIRVNLDNSVKCLSCFLEDVDVKPAAIAKKLRLDENFFFACRQLPTVEHIFSELYAVPSSVQKGYFKVKILELFLFLSSLKPEERVSEQRGFSETQIVLAKNVCSYLTEHVEKRIPMQELEEQFGVSASQINLSFRNLYGVSIANYMRGYRMQSAAKLLKKTDRTVLDIAGQFGYENGSKFANAFRAVMGVTPTKYRRGLYHKS